jgi:hypothetical protein
MKSERAKKEEDFPVWSLFHGREWTLSLFLHNCSSPSVVKHEQMKNIVRDNFDIFSVVFRFQETDFPVSGNLEASKKPTKERNQM